MFNRHRSANRFNLQAIRSISLTSLILVAHHISAQPATLEGTTLKIPVVLAGELAYAIDLSLVLGSSPITFDLISASEAATSTVDTTSPSIFEGSTLTIPSIQIDGSDFLVRLNLSGQNPIQFQLADFSVNDDPTANNALTLFQSRIATPIIQSR
jgi:hypothetical protein